MDMSHDSSSSNTTNDYIMHMTFYGGHKALILFDQWKTSTWGYYFLSLLGLFLFSIFYQWLQSRINGYSRGSGFDSKGSHLAWRLFWSLEYTLTVGTAYMLMLAVMTFNAGIFVVIVLGFGIGHFIFNTTAPSSSSSSSADAASKPAPTCCV